MSKKGKLINKFLEKPPRKDLTYQELETLLLSLGYKKVAGAGSRVKFYREDGLFPISLHKPHPGNILKGYIVKEIQKILRSLNDEISEI
jgi:predicted RNA binding protein YcfA (HicA-like mRNA interferase family)